jgi:hypothetical protein
MSNSHRRYPIVIFLLMALGILACSQCNDYYSYQYSTTTTNNVSRSNFDDLPVTGKIDNVVLSDLTDSSAALQISARIWVSGNLPSGGSVQVNLTFDDNSVIYCTSQCSQNVPGGGFTEVTFPLATTGNSAEDRFTIYLQYIAPNGTQPPLTGLDMYAGNVSLDFKGLNVVVNGTIQPSAQQRGLLLNQGLNRILLRNTSNQTISLQEVSLRTDSPNPTNQAPTAFIPAPDLSPLPPNSERELILDCQPQANVAQLHLRYTQTTQKYWYNLAFCMLPSLAQVQVSQRGISIPNGGQFGINPGFYEFEINLLNSTPATLNNLRLLPDGGADLLTLTDLGTTSVTTQSPVAVFGLTCANRADLPITRQIEFQYNNTPYRFSLTCQAAPLASDPFQPLGDPIGDAPVGDDTVIRQPPKNPDDPGGSGFLLGGVCRIIQFQVIFTLQSNLPTGTAISTSISDGGAGDAFSVSAGGAIAGNAFLTNLGNPPQAVTFFVNAGGLGSEALTLTCTP